VDIFLIITALIIGNYVAEYTSEMKDREKWTPTEHRHMMRECRRVCGKNQVKQYDPIDLCKCSKRKRK
jgi:hypothetical protein